MSTSRKTQSPVKAEAPAGKKPISRFKKGDARTIALAKQGAALGGRPAGAKNVLSEAKLKFLSIGGQTPLEFLHAVFRDQLYDSYDVEVVDEKKGIARVWPTLDPLTGQLVAKKIPVELGQRIAAATAAAPYVHRKMPIGIDGGEGKPLAFIGADQLARLSDQELGRLLEIMGRMGIGAEFAGADVRPPVLGD